MMDAAVSAMEEILRSGEAKLFTVAQAESTSA
jgi:hypothetical protein